MNNWSKKLFISLVIFTLLPLSAPAQDENDFPFPTSLYTLKNGLKIILSEDFSLPLVSVVVAYHVGSIYEKPGKAGLAYLLENLMFQGSRNIARMQHISFIQRIGGTLNAATIEDRTIFYQTVPSNQLALVLWLESDRMKSLEINFSKVEEAKESLIQEIHHRQETDPYLTSSLVFDQLLYPDFSHNHPVFGQEEDIRNITVADVKNFYADYYTPNNAVLTIVGHLNKRKTLQLIQKYFSSIPQGKEITPPPIISPQLQKTIIKTFSSSLASLPAFYLGYQIAPPSSPDYYPLRIIEYILLRGQTSRLYKRLITRQRIAFDLKGNIEQRRELAAFKIFVISSNEIMLARSEKAVLSEINKLRSSLVSANELNKAKNMFKMDYINQYATYLDRAIFLSENAFHHNNLDNLSSELKKYMSVGSSQIIGIMNRYFGQGYVLLKVKLK